jgi:hypothetical protein
MNNVRLLITTILITAFLSFTTVEATAKTPDSSSKAITEKTVHVGVPQHPFIMKIYPRISIINKQAVHLADLIKTEMKFIYQGSREKTIQSVRNQITHACANLAIAVRDFDSLDKSKHLDFISGASSTCFAFQKQKQYADKDESSIFKYGLYEYSLEQLQKSISFLTSTSINQNADLNAEYFRILQGSFNDSTHENMR